MATVVLPSRRPHQVIDVDLLDNLPSPPHRRRRVNAAPTNNWRSVPSSSASSASQDVIVIDSDDEDVQEVASFGPSQPRPRLRSPPAPIQRTTIPPLPLLPHGVHARWAPTPSTSGAPHRSGVVRPNPQPFAFERSLSSRAATPSTSASASQSTAAGPSNAPTPSAAPRSHHTPSMGFGGALLALNRQHVLQRNIEAEREAQRRRARRDELMRRIVGDTAPGIGGIRASRSGVLPAWLWQPGGAGSSSSVGVGAGTMSDLDWEVALDTEDEDDMGGGWRAGVFGIGSSILDRLGFGRRRGAVAHGLHMDEDPFAAHMARARPPFREAYTHPHPAAPGFTHNFAPGGIADATPRAKSTEVIVLDDDGDIIPSDPQEGPSSAVAGSSSNTATDEGTLLVCARCLDPLVLGADGPRRLWALRCGHMLDGKCVDALMRPPVQKKEKEEQEQEQEAVIPDRKGKGKAEVTDAVDSEQPGPTGRRDKGKGKAIDETPLPTPSLPTAGPSSPTSELLPPEVPTTPMVDNNPVRSRLRPRNQGGQVVHPTRSPPSSPSSTRATYSSPSSGSVRLPPLASVMDPTVDSFAWPTGNVQGRMRTARRSNAAKARAKGKGKATVPRVLETWTWTCPVTGCGKEHTSQRIGVEGEEERWVHKEGNGAIAIFA